MSAPAGRHSLAGALNATRDHRRDVLQATLDETGRAPVWIDPHDLTYSLDRRLDALWQRTGPAKRARAAQFAAALADDVRRRGIGQVEVTIEGAPL